MGKQKADDISAPHSGAKKHKKRVSRKVDDPPKPTRNQFQTIDSLYEEVEAILRSPSITAPPTSATLTHRKIPDLCNKKARTPHLTVEVDLHSPPITQAVIPSPSKRHIPNAEAVECTQTKESPHSGSKTIISSDIPCSNRFLALSTSSGNLGCSLPPFLAEPDIEEQDWLTQHKGALELAIISQKLDDLKSLVVVILENNSGLSDQRVTRNCKQPSTNDHNPDPTGGSNVLATLDTRDNSTIFPKPLSQVVEVHKHGNEQKGELSIPSYRYSY
ncbi:hypothetical protein NDU88_002414 [Pleurodeles waltl]|uniref:Uncharacterized protein n=1 Tax=Pleurodeles waltl TaxID=8319 RepID=A0AAV7P9L4_PLEWA|nr:hypothetical protein NDU88_002414 [Pleurodeles waltl]